MCSLFSGLQAKPNLSFLGMPVASCVITKGTKSDPKDDKGNPVVRPYTPITYDEVKFPF